MTDTKAQLVEHPPFPEQAIEVRQGGAVTTMDLIRQAVVQGAPIDTLRELFSLKREIEADDARKAYNQAFAAFKAEAIHIVKNITYTDGPLKGKKHADLFAVVDAVTPALSKHDLAMSWKITKDEKDWLEVTCVVRHKMGHSESVSMGSGPDAGPARNAIQSRASAKSYLERYTATAILGLAAENEDKDGIVPEEPKIPNLKDHLAAIEIAHSMASLKTIYNNAYKEAKEAGDTASLRAIVDARDARIKKLNETEAA